MADPTSGGTNIENLGIGFETNAKQAEGEIAALGKQVVVTAKSFNELDKSIADNTDWTNKAKDNWAKLEAQLKAENKALSDVKTMTEANATAGQNLIVKVKELVNTFGLSQTGLLTYKATQLGVIEDVKVYIAELEKLNRAELERNITQKRDIELQAQRTAEQKEAVVWYEKQFAEIEKLKQAETAFAAFKVRTLEENKVAEFNAMAELETRRLESVAKQESAMTALNAQRIRSLNENKIAEFNQMAEVETRRLQSLEKQQSAQTALNAQRRRALADNAREELRVKEESEKAAVSLAEKQAIEEIQWAQKSAKVKLAELERIKLYQASGNISSSTITNMFGASAVADIGNLEKYKKLVDELPGSHKKAGESVGFLSALFSTARTRTEALVVAHEALQGRYSRIPGSLMVLAEYTNKMTTSMIGLNLPTAIVVTTLVALGYALAKGQHDQKLFNDALILTGGYSAATADDLYKFSKAAASTGASITVAKQAVLELANSGKFTSAQIAQISVAVTELEHATGQSIKTTIKQFESLEVEAKGSNSRTSIAIAENIEKLDQQYHFLNTSILQEIINLEKEGKQKEASALATATFAAAVKTMAEESAKNIGLVERAWNGVRNGITNAIDAVGNFGKAQTAATKVAGIQSKLAEIDGRKDSSGNIVDPNTVRGKLLGDERAKVLEELKSANQVLFREAETATMKAYNRQVQSTGDAALLSVEATLRAVNRKSMTRAQEEEEKYRKGAKDVQNANPNNDAYSDANIEKKAQEVYKFYSKQEKAVGDGHKRILALDTKHEADLLKIAMDSANAQVKLVQMFVKDGLVDTADGARQIADIRKAELDDVNEKADAQIAIYKSYNARHGKESDITIRKIREVEDARKRAIENINAQVEMQNIKASGFYTDTVDENATNSKEVKKLEEQIKKQKEHNKEIGKTAEQIQLLKEVQDKELIVELQLQEVRKQSAIDSGELSKEELQAANKDIENIEKRIALIKEEAQLHHDAAYDEARAAITKAADTSYKELNKKIGNDLADAIVSGGGNGLKKLIKDMEIAFAKTILQPILEPISNGVAAFANPGASLAAGNPFGVGSGGGGISSLYSAGKTLFDGFNNGFAAVGNQIATTVQKGINIFSGGGSYGPGVNSALAEGAGTVGSYGGGLFAGHTIGNMISGKYGVGDHGQAVVNTASVIGAVVGGPIGAAIGGAIGGLINRAFGHGPKEDRGHGIEGDFGDGFVGNNYSNYHQSGGWFSSDRNGTDRSPLDGQIQQQFNSGYSDIKNATSQSSELLGLGTNSFSGYSKNVNLAFGSDANANTKMVTDLFNTIGNELATQVLPGVAEFQAKGEELSATLQRVATDSFAVSGILGAIGIDSATAFGSVLQNSVKAKEAIIALSGGLANLSSNVSNYYKNFYSAGEQTKLGLGQIATTLANLGIGMPKTREQFRQLVDSLDLTTSFGQKAFAALMNVSGAFAGFVPAATNAVKSVLDAKTQLVNSYNTEKSALQSTIDKFTQFSFALKTFKDGLTLGSLSPLNPLDKYNNARQQFNDTFAAAKGGDANAQANFQSVVSSFLSASQTANASSDAYTADFAATQQAISDLTLYSNTQKDTAQVTLDAMTATVSQLVELNTNVVTVQDAILQLGQSKQAEEAQTLAIQTARNNTNSLINANAVQVSALNDQIAALRKEQAAQTAALIAANNLVTTQAAKIAVAAAADAANRAAYATSYDGGGGGGGGGGDGTGGDAGGSGGDGGAGGDGGGGE